MNIIKKLTAAASMAALLIPGALNAAEAPSMRMAPVDAFYCNLNPGKTMADLDAVHEQFSKWADKHDSAYWFWQLTPEYAVFDKLPDFILLGSNSDPKDFGKGIDTWKKSGGEVGAAYAEVASCGAHVLASSVEINAPSGEPTDGVIMFQACTIAEGSSGGRAIAAHKAFSEYMRSKGEKSSEWLFFPTLGGPGNPEFSYLSGTAVKTHEELFEGYEIYFNGGGRQKAHELFSGISDCGVGTVYNFKLLHKGK